MPNYHEFFIRAKKHESFLVEPFKAPLRFYSDTDRNCNLVSDCFGQLVEYRNRKAKGLTFNHTLPARWITEDELCAHFIKRHYVIPELIPFDAPLTTPPLPYDQFLRETVSSAFATEETEQNNLGTNRLRFIVGEPGEGKTAFLSRMIVEIERERTPVEPKINDDRYKIVCVLLNLENYFDRQTHEPLSLKPDFHRYFFETLKRTADSRLRDDNCPLPQDWEKLTASGDPVISIQRLVQLLRLAGYRVALFIDNVDYYATCWERYNFFPEYDRKMNTFIDQNLRWLRKELTSLDSLGNTGLCIVLALRPTTFYNLFNGRHGLETAHFSSLAYQLKPVPQSIVIGSRLALLADAVKIVGRHRSATNKQLEDFHRDLRRRFADAHPTKPDSETTLRPATTIDTIYLLGQHGHRSLIQFFSTLNFGYEETNIFERFFAHEPVTLLELYYNNNFRKFSQSQKHFPNLFLNDCLALKDSSFQEAHKPHVHTYWLKFLVLAYVKQKVHSNLHDLLAVFSQSKQKYHYEPHLLRLVVGSLATSDESACLRVDPDPTIEIDDRSITVTQRGTTLLADFIGIPMYLSFRYLSAVTDDYLLSYPPDAMKRIFDPKLDSSSLFALGEQYVKDSTDKLRRKAQAALHFLGILQDSLETERAMGKIPNDPTCNTIVAGLNFPAAEAAIIDSAGAIFSKLRGDSMAKEVQKELAHVAESRKNKNYKNHFTHYLQSGSLIAE